MATNAWRPREPAVSGEKRVAERLGERDVRRVVGSHPGAQFIGTDHQRACREAIEGEGQEVVDAIETVPTGAQDRPLDNVVINSVSIERSDS